jgi:hypothetical protein
MLRSNWLATNRGKQSNKHLALLQVVPCGKRILVNATVQRMVALVVLAAVLPLNVTPVEVLDMSGPAVKVAIRGLGVSACSAMVFATKAILLVDVVVVEAAMAVDSVVAVEVVMAVVVVEAVFLKVRIQTHDGTHPDLNHSWCPPLLS